MFFRISPFSCCSCPPEGYKPAFILWVLYLNKYVAPVMDCVDCRNFGCTLNRYVIPIETLSASTIFGILWFRNKRKSSQHRS